MADGFDATTFQLQGVSKIIKSIIFYNNFFFEEGSRLFTDFPNERGPAFKFPIEYSHTQNGGTYSYDDPMPESDEVAGVFATFNKTPYQKSIRTYNLLKAMNVGDGESIDTTALGTAISNDPIMQRVLASMKAQMMSAWITQIEADIDSAGSYSDSTLLRSTYGLASYEDARSSEALTLNMMEDAVEALQSTSYGAAMQDEITILMPNNQITNLGRLQSATVGTEIDTSNFPMATNAQDMSPVDAGRRFRVKSFDGIPIINVPGMTSTNILFVRNGTLRRCDWRGVETKEKSVDADQSLYHVVAGADVFCDMPSWCGKISGLTA